MFFLGFATCTDRHGIFVMTHRTDRSDRSRSRSSRSQPVVIICCAGSVTTQIQPRKRVPDHADYTAPIRQHERDHTDAGIYLLCPDRSIYQLWESMICQLWESMICQLWESMICQLWESMICQLWESMICQLWESMICPRR